MTAATTDTELRERLACLERELRKTMAAFERRDEPPRERAPGPQPLEPPREPPRQRAPRPQPLEPPRERPRPTRPPRRVVRDVTSLSDFLGGRALAWIGGIATLLGIVLLLVLAVSHGWIGREARVVLAGTASVAWMLAGIRLHARRGRTEAAVVMVGAATAGMFATLIVAGEVYQLDPRAGRRRGLDARRRARDRAGHPLGRRSHRRARVAGRSALAGARGRAE